MNFYNKNGLSGLIILNYGALRHVYEHSLPKKKYQTFSSSVPCLLPSGVPSTLEQAPNSSILI